MPLWDLLRAGAEIRGKSILTDRSTTWPIWSMKVPGWRSVIRSLPEIFAQKSQRPSYRYPARSLQGPRRSSAAEMAFRGMYR